MFDQTDDLAPLLPDPILSEADVVGLYPADAASAAARASMTDDGSGNWRQDD